MKKQQTHGSATEKVWRIANLLSMIAQGLDWEDFWPFSRVNRASAKAIRETMCAEAFYLQLSQSESRYIWADMQFYHDINNEPIPESAWAVFPPPRILNYTSLEITPSRIHLLSNHIPVSSKFSEIFLTIEPNTHSESLSTLHEHFSSKWYRLRISGQGVLTQNICESLFKSEAEFKEIEIYAGGMLKVPASFPVNSLNLYWDEERAPLVVDFNISRLEHLWLQFCGVLDFPEECLFPEDFPSLKSICVINVSSNQKMSKAFIEKLQTIIDSAPELKLLHISETAQNVFDAIGVPAVVYKYVSKDDSAYKKHLRML